MRVQGVSEINSKCVKSCVLVLTLLLITCYRANLPILISLFATYEVKPFILFFLKSFILIYLFIRE